VELLSRRAGRGGSLAASLLLGGGHDHVGHDGAGADAVRSDGAAVRPDHDGRARAGDDAGAATHRGPRSATARDRRAGARADYYGPLPIGGCTISSVVRLNTRSRDVVCVERCLGRARIRFDGPDDLFSVHSVNSLKAWQRGQGILADGIVGPVTGGRLGIWGGAVAPAAPHRGRRTGRPRCLLRAAAARRLRHHD
jgi:hypothetical protein